MKLTSGGRDFLRAKKQKGEERDERTSDARNTRILSHDDNEVRASTNPSRWRLIDTRSQLVRLFK